MVHPLQIGVHGLIINFFDHESRVARNATFLPEVADHEARLQLYPNSNPETNPDPSPTLGPTNSLNLFAPPTRVTLKARHDPSIAVSTVIREGGFNRLGVDTDIAEVSQRNYHKSVFFSVRP